MTKISERITLELLEADAGARLDILERHLDGKGLVELTTILTDVALNVMDMWDAHLAAAPQEVADRFRTTIQFHLDNLGEAPE